MLPAACIEGANVAKYYWLGRRPLLCSGHIRPRRGRGEDRQSKVPSQQTYNVVLVAAAAAEYH
jgi:hypothetical protein